MIDLDQTMEQTVINNTKFIHCLLQIADFSSVKSRSDLEIISNIKELTEHIKNMNIQFHKLADLDTILINIDKQLAELTKKVPLSVEKTDQNRPLGSSLDIELVSHHSPNLSEYTDQDSNTNDIPSYKKENNHPLDKPT